MCPQGNTAAGVRRERRFHMGSQNTRFSESRCYCILGYCKEYFSSRVGCPINIENITLDSE